MICDETPPLPTFNEAPANHGGKVPQAVAFGLTALALQ